MVTNVRIASVGSMDHRGCIQNETGSFEFASFLPIHLPWLMELIKLRNQNSSKILKTFDTGQRYTLIEKISKNTMISLFL
jgi:hypothetical protein